MICKTLLNKLLEAQASLFLSLLSELDQLILIKWRHLMVMAPLSTLKNLAGTEIETSFNSCHSVLLREIQFFSLKKSWLKSRDSSQISSKGGTSFQILKLSKIDKACWLETRWEIKWPQWWEKQIMLEPWRKHRWFRRCFKWVSTQNKWQRS